VVKRTLAEAVPSRRGNPMYGKVKNPIVVTPQIPAGLVTDLLRTAERELVAFI
jgi:hypothetical protein